MNFRVSRSDARFHLDASIGTSFDDIRNRVAQQLKVQPRRVVLVAKHRILKGKRTPAMIGVREGKTIFVVVRHVVAKQPPRRRGRAEKMTGECEEPLPKEYRASLERGANAFPYEPPKWHMTMSGEDKTLDYLL